MNKQGGEERHETRADAGETNDFSKGRLGVAGLELSADGEYLYYHALVGRTLLLARYERCGLCGRAL